MDKKHYKVIPGTKEHGALTKYFNNLDNWKNNAQTKNLD